MKKALVIIICDHSRAVCRDRARNAAAIAGLLETHGDGSPNFDVALRSFPSGSASIASMRSAIGELYEGDLSVGLLYISGSGTAGPAAEASAAKGFLTGDRSLALADVMKLAARSNARDRVIILDSCNSGAIPAPISPAAGVSVLPDGIEILTSGEHSGAASDPDAPATFSSLLVAALERGAADVRGNITASSTFAYIDQVMGSTDQRPVFRTSAMRFAALRIVSRPADLLATLQKVTEYFATPHGTFELDPSYVADAGGDRVAAEGQIRAPGNAKTAVMKDLHRLRILGLVVPSGEKHLYLAARNSKSCRLTALGAHYWKLVKDNAIFSVLASDSLGRNIR